MSRFCEAHRLPRAGVDPIVGPGPALAVVRMAMHQPPIDETIALVLDGERRGRSIVVVDATTGGDDVLEVVERLAEMVADGGGDGALVVASVRPGLRPDDADADRWCEATEIADELGVELVEWFVLDGPRRWWCPREHLGEPARW